MGPAVINLDQEMHVRKLCPHSTHARGERTVKDDHAGVRVIKQIDEFLVEVPVVDVDGHGSMLKRSVLGDEILRAVVEIESNLSALGYAGRFDRGGEASGGVIERPVVVSLIALHDGDTVRYEVDNFFPR
jgi:hypothetical protein